MPWPMMAKRSLHVQRQCMLEYELFEGDQGRRRWTFMPCLWAAQNPLVGHSWIRDGELEAPV